MGYQINTTTATVNDFCRRSSCGNSAEAEHLKKCVILAARLAVGGVEFAYGIINHYAAEVGTTPAALIEWARGAAREVIA